LIHERVHVLTRSGFQMLVGALCVLPFMLQQGDSIGVVQWGWLLVAGIVPGFLAIMLAVVALRALPAATFGTLAYLEPITVVALGRDSGRVVAAKPTLGCCGASGGRGLSSPIDIAVDGGLTIADSEG